MLVPEGWCFPMWWFIFIVSIGSILLAGQMARARKGSFRTWLWTAVFIGPLAPLALLIFGGLDRKTRHPAA
jgi:hypothetical protein